MQSPNRANQNLPAMDDLRRRVLEQTTGVIRRRRWARRAAFATTCVGCYLAGLFTVTLTGSEQDASANRQPGIVQTESTQPRPTDSSDTEVSPAPPPRERKIVRRGSMEEKSRFISLRDLGDHYLLEKLDPAGATRCYKMALRYATPAEIENTPDKGTWLFRALEQDHHWENDDADQQG